MTHKQVAYKAPDPSLVERALLRLGDIQARRVFYEGLQNPLWVGALDRAGAFATSPSLVIDDDGCVRSRPWPEGDYLARMAAEAPNDVVNVLGRHLTSENPYVLATIVSSAGNMPATQAVRLAPAAEALLASGYRQLAQPEEIVRIIDVLAHSDHKRQAQTLAQAAFRPRGEPTGDFREHVTAGLEDYWYAEQLPKAIKALGPLGDKVLTMLVIWLELFQSLSGSWREGSDVDTSCVWRPAIADHEQNARHNEIANALVEGLRDLAIAQAVAGRPVVDVVECLARSKQPIMRRIALHVLESRVREEDAAALDCAAEWLLKAELTRADYRYEYVELARAALPMLDEDTQSAWAQLVTAGPPGDDEEITHRAERFAEAGDPNPAETYRQIWQLGLLGNIGFEALPQAAQTRLSELEAVHGPNQQPQLASSFHMWSGNESPISIDGLADMSPREALDYVTEWAPLEGFGRESVRGLAEVLTAVVAQRATEYSENATLAIGIAPTFVRAIVEGLERALKEDRPPAWGTVLTLGSWIAGRPDNGADEVDFEHDVVWRYAQRAIANLFGQAAQADDPIAPPPAILMGMLDVLEPLTRHADPTARHEEEYGGTNMDPLTLSLNTTRPTALRAVGHIARRARVEVAAGTSDALPVLNVAMRIFRSRFGPASDPSRATAAVFGEMLVLLAIADESWLIKAMSELAQSDLGSTYEETVATTALGLYNPSHVLLTILRPSLNRMIAAAADGRPPELGWRTQRSAMELIGDHLLAHFVSGTVSREDPLLETFMAKSDVGTRASVLGHLGWKLMNSEEVDDGILRNAQSLWDWRANAVSRELTPPDELHGFYWWIRSGKFDPSWWLPRLKQVSDDAAFEPRGMLGGPLEDAAYQHPGEALDILRRLLTKQEDRHFTRHDLIRHAPGVIAAALASSRPEVQRDAQELMDSLARMGHVNMRDLVAQVQRSPQPTRDPRSPSTLP